MTAKFAYFLGWMYSDGCVLFDKRCNSAVVKIKILKSDEETLRLFSDVTDWSVSYEKDKYVTMRKNSNELAKKLINYGVLPQKSHINNFALRRPRQVTDDLMPYFIRGFFDGDGTYNWEIKSSYMMSCGCCGKCYYLFKDFQKYLEARNIKSELRETRPEFYILRIRTREDVKRFVDLIFADNLELVLKRKYNKIKTYLDNYHTTKEWLSISHRGNPSNFGNPETHKKAMETRAKNFVSGKTRPSMLGKHHSEETKKKISESNKKAHPAHVK